MIREIHSEEAGKLYECLETLAEHHNRVSVHFKGCYPKTPSEQRIKQFESELDAGKSRIAVIENDSHILGFCKIGTDGNTGVLEYLVVLDQERGKGYGTSLMDWAMNTFQILEVNEIEVKVVYGNEAIRLYEKYGFRAKSVIMALHRSGERQD